MALGAVGGGLIEVLVSPIVEAAPSSHAKDAAMSLLHSFYCWGHVAVVVLSTVGVYHIWDGSMVPDPCPLEPCPDPEPAPLYQSADPSPGGGGRQDSGEAALCPPASSGFLSDL